MCAHVKDISDSRVFASYQDAVSWLRLERSGNENVTGENEAAKEMKTLVMECAAAPQ